MQVVCTTTDAAVMMPFLGLNNNLNVSTASFNPSMDIEVLRDKVRILRSMPDPAVEILKMVGWVTSWLEWLLLQQADDSLCPA